MFGRLAPSSPSTTTMTWWAKELARIFVILTAAQVFGGCSKLVIPLWQASTDCDVRPHTHTHTHTYIHTYTHTHTHTYTHTHTDIHTHTLTHARTHTHIQRHSHIYTNTHMYTTRITTQTQEPRATNACTMHIHTCVCKQHRKRKHHKQNMELAMGQIDTTCQQRRQTTSNARAVVCNRPLIATGCSRQGIKPWLV